MNNGVIGRHGWLTLVLVAAGWLVSSGMASAQPMAPKMGTTAPEFAPKDATGATTSLSQERIQGPVVSAAMPRIPRYGES